MGVQTPRPPAFQFVSGLRGQLVPGIGFGVTLDEQAFASDSADSGVFLLG